MGWTNFIIIPKLKLVFETTKNLSELLYHKSEALDQLIVEEDTFDHVLDTKVIDLNIETLTTLTNGYVKYSNLVNTTPDEMFLYWLESHEIKYKIENEFNINLNDYKDYVIIRRN